MRELAETYFGSIEPTGTAPSVTTKEPRQRGERRFVIEEESQPILIAGYHTVDQLHDDFAALTLLASILSDGRTSRLYSRLVQDEQQALAVQAVTGFPAPNTNLWLVCSHSRTRDAIC